MAHWDLWSDANRSKPGPPGRTPGGLFLPSGNADRSASLPPSSEAEGLAKRATDDDFKRELLREAAEWDDVNDRIAPISDDTEG